MVFQFIIIVTLLIFSAFFSASETAVFSLTKFQLKRIQTSYPIQGKRLAFLLDKPRRTLITLLVGNTVVNVMATSAATIIGITLFGDTGVGIAILFMTFILITFGEVTPKIFAIKNAQSLSAIIATPLDLFAKLIFPIRRLIKIITDSIISSLIGKESSSEPYITEGELKTLISIGEREGIINEDEKEMIRAVFEFTNRAVNEIMVPRVDIVAYDINKDVDMLVTTMKESKHIKIPIYQNTVDKIIGYVDTKEFLLGPRNDIKSFLKQILFVPQTKRINELLMDFQTKRIYISVVIDEYGGTAGLVTLEDILEEIVGDIQDEFDKEEKSFEAIGDGALRFSAGVSLKDVDEKLNTYIHTTKVQTLGGLVLYLFGRIPQKGDTVTYKDVTLTIDEVKDNRVKSVIIKKKR